MKIMIVDDEPFIRKGLVSMMRQHSPEFEIVGEADNGAAGCEIALRTNPDVVITDIRMPDMDGIELIERLHERLPRTQFIILSGYEDVAYYRKAMSCRVMHYLLKPITSDVLVQTLRQLRLEHQVGMPEKDMQYVRESLLRQLLFSEIHEAAIQYLDKMLAVETGYVRIGILMKAPDSDPLVSADEQLAALCHPETDVLMCLEEQAKLYVVYASRHSQDAGDHLRLADWCARQQVYMGMSRWKSDMRQLLEAKSEAEEALRERLVYPEKHLIVYTRRRSAAEPAIGQETLRRLEEAFERQELKRIKDELAQFAARIRHEPGLHVHLRVRDVLDLVWIKLVQMREQWLGPLDANAPALPEQLKSIDSIYNMDAYIQTVADLLDKWHQLHIVPHRLPVREEVRKMLAYIHQHFDQSITLEELATNLFLNPVYASQLFKRETGMNVGEYVTDLRIQKAKSMLQYSNETVNRISEWVGYQNPKYFSRLFKKKVGMTPVEYRNQELRPQ